LCLTHWGFFVIVPIMNKDFRKIDLKLIKASEIIIKLKTKYLSEPSIYADIHKIDERLEEISKIVKNDNSK
jgi:hypothetical protein